MLVTFAAVPVDKDTAEPDAIVEEISSPTLPAEASLFVVVPMMPDVDEKVMLGTLLMAVPVIRTVPVASGNVHVRLAAVEACVNELLNAPALFTAVNPNDPRFAVGENKYNEGSPDGVAAEPTRMLLKKFAIPLIAVSPPNIGVLVVPIFCGVVKVIAVPVTGLPLVPFTST
jgi:hypothetical protein